MSELTQYLKEVAKQLEIQNAYNELNRASQNNENQATDKFNDTLKAIEDKYAYDSSRRVTPNRASLKTLNRVKAIEDKYAKAMRTLERLRKSRLSRNHKNSTQIENLIKQSENGFNDYYTRDDQYNFATSVAQELEKLKNEYIISPKEAKNIFGKYVFHTNEFHLSDHELYKIKFAYGLD